MVVLCIGVRHSPTIDKPSHLFDFKLQVDLSFTAHAQECYSKTILCENEGITRYILANAKPHQVHCVHLLTIRWGNHEHANAIHSACSGSELLHALL